MFLLSRVSGGVALAFAAVLATSGPAFASQLLMKSDCTFILENSGLFGTQQLKHSVRGGTVFNQDDRGKYCGTATMDTPFGPGSSESCFVVENGQLISGVWGHKISSSTCTLVEAVLTTTVADKEVAAFAGAGPANLHGQAFLKTVGGDVKTCATEEVRLMPGIPYFDELIEKTKSGLDIHADKRAADLVRRTICDAQGNFSFTGVPAQKWYIATMVTWDVPRVETYATSMDRQGGELIQSIDLRAGDNQAFLTGRDSN